MSLHRDVRYRSEICIENGVTPDIRACFAHLGCIKSQDIVEKILNGDDTIHEQALDMYVQEKRRTILADNHQKTTYRDFMRDDIPSEPRAFLHYMWCNNGANKYDYREDIPWKNPEVAYELNSYLREFRRQVASSIQYLSDDLHTLEHLHLTAHEGSFATYLGTEDFKESLQHISYDDWREIPYDAVDRDFREISQEKYGTKHEKYKEAMKTLYPEYEMYKHEILKNPEKSQHTFEVLKNALQNLKLEDIHESDLQKCKNILEEFGAYAYELEKVFSLPVSYQHYYALLLQSTDAVVEYIRTKTHPRALQRLWPIFWAIRDISKNSQDSQQKGDRIHPRRRGDMNSVLPNIWHMRDTYQEKDINFAHYHPKTCFTKNLQDFLRREHNLSSEDMIRFTSWVRPGNEQFHFLLAHKDYKADNILSEVVQIVSRVVSDLSSYHPEYYTFRYRGVMYIALSEMGSGFFKDKYCLSPELTEICQKLWGSRHREHIEGLCTLMTSIVAHLGIPIIYLKDSYYSYPFSYFAKEIFALEYDITKRRAVMSDILRTEEMPSDGHTIG